MAVLTSPSDADLLRDWQDGSEVDTVLLVREVATKHKRDGSPYLRLTLGDRSGTMAAVCWEPAAQTPVRQGDVVQVRGTVADHPRWGRQLTLSDLQPVPAGEAPLDRLVDGPRRDPDDLEAALDALLESITDPHLARLANALLGCDSIAGRRYRSAPAAKYNHHAYAHGLLEHSVEAARLVDTAARTLPDINRDLAVCGALLHDIGKLEAYVADPVAIDLTDAGKLEGEIPMGYFLVRSTIGQLPGFPEHLARELLHIILAHHGSLEFGSPVAPATREAVLVAAMDNLSGTMGTFDRLEKETEEGERWSRFDRTLGGSAFLR